VDPTAVADRIVEHLIARVRAQPSVEPSPPDSLAPATPVSGPQESVAGPPGAGQQAPPAPSLPALTPAEQEDRREREPTNAPETSAESPGTESADGEPWQLPQWQYNKKRARINQRQKRK
jgi:hypothetical protein